MLCYASLLEGNFGTLDTVLETREKRQPSSQMQCSQSFVRAALWLTVLRKVADKRNDGISQQPFHSRPLAVQSAY